MWRWILGIVAFVILALVGTCYAGYRRITGGGNTVVAMVPGDPSRTFTLLTDRDSLLEWMPEGTTAMPERHGPLRVGDTIRVAAPTRSNAPSGRALQLWVIREVRPPNALVVEAIEFDPGGLAHTAFTRHDSLVAAGDSTQIVSTFIVAPLFSGADSAAITGRPVAGSLLSAAERMRLGAARLMWQSQLRRLGHRDSGVK
jgi:hypothetical protein